MLPPHVCFSRRGNEKFSVLVSIVVTVHDVNVYNNGIIITTDKRTLNNYDI
jgi:hypothetical protein